MAVCMVGGNHTIVVELGGHQQCGGGVQGDCTMLAVGGHGGPYLCGLWEGTVPWWGGGAWYLSGHTMTSGHMVQGL